jgi:integration host factor subunit alpha
MRLFLTRKYAMSAKSHEDSKDKSKTRETPSKTDGEAGAAQESTGTITRADLTEAVHKTVGLTRMEAAKCVETVLEAIFESIVAGENVKLSSFGAFQVRSKKERLGRNPKTGADAKIAARRVVSFKPSTVLRAKINSGAKNKK